MRWSIRSAGVRPWAVPLLVWSLAGCREEAEPAPTPPDMQPVLSQFEHPEGALTADNATETLQAFVERLNGLADALLLFEFVNSMVGSWANSGESGSGLTTASAGHAEDGAALSTAQQGLSLAAGAWGRLIHQCGGWGDGLRGTFQLMNTADLEGGLGEVFWGRFSDCHLSVEDRQIRFDGDVRLLTPFQRPEVGFLLVFSGISQQAGEAQKPFELELRIANDEVQLRQPLPSGEDIVVAVSTSTPEGALPELRVRGAVNWTCGLNDELTGGQCTSDGGETIDW